MGHRLDHEDRLSRGHSALEAVVDLLGTSQMSVDCGRLGCLLDLIHAELVAATPRMLSARLGDNDPASD